MNELEVILPLTGADAKEFADKLKFLKKGAKGFTDYTKVLHDVWKRQLWRAKFKSFELFLEEIGIKERTGYELVKAVQLTLELEATAEPQKPQHAENLQVVKRSSANAVSKLAAVPAEKRHEVIAAATTSKGTLTGASIEKAKAKVAHRKEPEKPLPRGGIAADALRARQLEQMTTENLREHDAAIDGKSGPELYVAKLEAAYARDSKNLNSYPVADPKGMLAWAIKVIRA